MRKREDGLITQYQNGEYADFVSEVYSKYPSMRAFCKAANINAANLASNLTNKYKMSMERMFSCANALRIPIEQMIIWFWKDEYEGNQDVQNMPIE